ncbi:hypothetical protein AM506_03045 [Rossellomorea vietnamensis]|uniref:Uncharacterized protein n=1 Tax=Rossellomorea vietnamensis TaxID=218284 RepID=A0A0P6W3M2_9BACI|nr:hypothetical protein AM506_03045 [Rossellomorea vietnamensis]
MWKFVEKIVKKRVYFIAGIGYTNQCKKKITRGRSKEMFVLIEKKDTTSYRFYHSTACGMFSA